MSNPGKVRHKVVRAAANLAISANENTDSIQCFSGRQVGWLVTAGDADTLATANVQVSNDNVNFITVAPTGFGVDGIGLVTGVALNAGGRWRMLVPNGDNSTARYVWCIPWMFARLNLINGAAQIDNLRVDAYCWDDIEFAVNGQGLPPFSPV